MPKLANISGKNVVKIFLKFGYHHVHTSGDHAILQKNGAPSLSIPLHKEVAPFLLFIRKTTNVSLWMKRIPAQAGLAEGLNKKIPWA